MPLPPLPPALIEGAQTGLPPKAQVAFDRAYKELNAGRFSEAVIAYEEALALAPDSWDIWLEYTSALRQAGTLQKAARAGWKSVNLGPDQVSSWINLSNVLLAAHALPEDLALLDLAARRFPGDPKVTKGFDNLGYTAWCLQDYPLATKALDRTLQLDPGNLVAQVDKAGVGLSARLPGARVQMEAALAAAEKAGDKGAAAWAKQLLDASKGGTLNAPYPETWATEILPPRLRTWPAPGTETALPVEDPVPHAFLLQRRGSLRVAIPAGWRQSLAGSSPQEGLVNLSYAPKEGESFVIKVTAMMPPEAHPKAITQEVAKGILEGQFQQEKGVQVHWLPETRGAMAWARDPSWKPGKPDDFPNLLTAVLQVGPATVTISCFWGEQAQEPPKAFLDLIASIGWVSHT